MDYEAEDKGIFEKITTEALKRVMAESTHNDIIGHWEIKGNADDIRLAVDGADILLRRASGIMRPRLAAIRAALMQATA